MSADSSAPPASSTRPVLRILVVLGAALCLSLSLTVGYVFFLEPTLRRTTITNDSGSPPGGTPFIMPGLRQPPTVAAAAAELDDAEEVAGVGADGKHRAYRLSVMMGARGVINDLLGDVPVTVTRCERSGVVRAFTSADRGKLLDISMGGWIRDRLVLRAAGGFYSQDSGQPLNPAAMKPFPFVELPLRRAAWKDWKKTHPDTDVFIGAPAAPAPFGPPVAPPPAAAKTQTGDR